MQVIIPMSGRGDRFLRAGYAMPKPLIPIDGKPMIEHVIDLFPGVEKMVFVCNREHLQTTDLGDVLRRLRPTATIVAIAPHKLGPVYATLQARDLIDQDDEVIVNYCDFSTPWDFDHFRRTVRAQACDGCITAYRGFHPHSLGSTLYAYLRHTNLWLDEIQEKSAYTSNRMDEFASAGTYYFAKGRLVTKYFADIMKTSQQIHGEYYVSLVYNLMQADGLKTFIYEVDQFLQWGTPDDLEEYLEWSRIFHGLGQPAPSLTIPHGTNVMPLAGEGRRFIQAGFEIPKPLILIDGAPMIIRASASAPGAARWVYLCRAEHLAQGALASALQQAHPDAQIVPINRPTDGQACTCLLAEPYAPPDQPLFIGACDNEMLWDAARLQSRIENPQIDALIWTFSHHAGVRRHPQMYSYVEVDGARARRVSMKQALSDRPDRDHAVVGAFWFREARLFFDAARQLIARNARTHGEFYVDRCLDELIRAGKRVEVFPIDHYVGWGTPDELNTYGYWARYFSRCQPISR